jgi:PAS domain S-box-containing protein
LERKPTYEELERRIRQLEQGSVENNKTKEILEQKENKYRDIFENASEGIFQTTPDGRIITANQAMAQMLGYDSPEDLITSIADIEKQIYVDPDHRAGFQRLLGGFNVISNLECQYYRKDRTKIWVSENVRTVRNANGKTLHYEGTIENITDRKLAEEALRKSEDRYRVLFDNNPVDTITVDRKGKITGYNLARKRSNTRLPIINSDVMYKDYAAKHKTDMFEELMECIRSGESKEFPEKEYNDKFLDIKIAPFPEGAIITSINVTERKRAEEELRKSESRYRSVFENTGTATVIIDEDRTLSMVNNEFEKLSGYSREEIEGKKKWTDFVVKEDLKKMEEYHRLRRVDPASATRKYEFRFVDRYGAVKDILITVDVIPGTGRSVASCIDISGRKQAEVKLRGSLHEKEVLLQEIHHRVKNNMQIISSLLNLQSEYVKDKESLEMFNESRNRIFSMASVHEKLYQSGDLTKIDFDSYIKSLSRHLLLTYSVNQSLVRLNVNCSDVYLSIDKAVPCGLIINELISNALKHAFPEESEGEITVDFYPDGDNRVVLVIRDNGAGFPEDIDIGDSRTLGLHLVSALVAQLKGTMDIQRSGGTVFKVKFGT